MHKNEIINMSIYKYIYNIRTVLAICSIIKIILDQFLEILMTYFVVNIVFVIGFVLRLLWIFSYF